VSRRRRSGVRAGLSALVVALLATCFAAAADAPPRRVASLNLAADEVLAEILPTERLVAVTRFVDEPGTSNALGRIPPSVLRLPKADLERIVALSADLVVVSEYTDADFLDLLARSGLRHHRMRGLRSLEGIRAAILDLGRAVGEEPAARRLVERYDTTLAELQRRLVGVRPTRVLYWSGGMTAGADTAIGALIEGAGGVNVGRELGLTGIVPPGSERAFVADPDAILVGTWPGAVESVRGDPLLGQSRAVREGRVVTLPSELVVALSQHAADACWELAVRLHPERVAGRRP
jgi:iron complex transport system substrate-binding protein